MRTYIPVEEREHYQPTEFYACKTCNNTTFSSLPRSTEPMTELSSCSVCGVSILFSTTELPKRIGYPRSRRQWNPERVQILPISRVHEAEYYKQPSMF